MAKAAKKKDPKEASNLFHNIMKASVNIDDNKKDKSGGAREWFFYDHPITGRKYVIRYYYEDGDKQRKCTVSLESNNSNNSSEELIADYKYPSNRQGIEINENAKMKAINHGNMQPPDYIS